MLHQPSDYWAEMSEIGLFAILPIVVTDPDDDDLGLSEPPVPLAESRAVVQCTYCTIVDR